MQRPLSPIGVLCRLVGGESRQGQLESVGVCRSIIENSERSSMLTREGKKRQFVFLLRGESQAR